MPASFARTSRIFSPLPVASSHQRIDDLLETLRGSFARLRQGVIDAELFDVTSGYEALSPRLA